MLATTIAQIGLIARGTLRALHLREQPVVLRLHLVEPCLVVGLDGLLLGLELKLTTLERRRSLHLRVQVSEAEAEAEAEAEEEGVRVKEY